MVAAEIAHSHAADIDTDGHWIMGILVFKNQARFDASVLTFVCSGPADPLERVLIVRFAYDGQSERIWTLQNEPVAWLKRGRRRVATEESCEESHVRAA